MEAARHHHPDEVTHEQGQHQQLGGLVYLMTFKLSEIYFIKLNSIGLMEPGAPGSSGARAPCAASSRRGGTGASWGGSGRVGAGAGPGAPGGTTWGRGAVILRR